MPYEFAPNALKLFKAALGIPENMPLQKLVIEVDAGCIPKVYIQGLVTKGPVESVAALLATEHADVTPVADVTVDEQGEVTKE